MEDLVNIVVMGKTGAGKSTLINSVLGKELAPTGIGQAITTEVMRYSAERYLHKLAPDGKSYTSVQKKLILHDTVGLEIDTSITKRTLEDIRGILKRTHDAETGSGISLVWFCLNNSTSRFEPYESELIRQLSIEYEIPFVIVITQCYSDEKGELEEKIEEEMPELPVLRVLAKEKKLRSGEIRESFGVDRLLQDSVEGFNNRKVTILNSKLRILLETDNKQIDGLYKKGKNIILYYSVQASKAGIVAVPFTKRDKTRSQLFMMMMTELTGLFKKDVKISAITRVVPHALSGLLSPRNAISSKAFSSFITKVGTEYLDALYRAAISTAGFIGSEGEIERILNELNRWEGDAKYD